MKLFPITIPGGSDTHVQYNNGGIFGGDSTFTFNDSTKVVDMDGLTITGTIATGLDMSGGTFATSVINLPTTPIIQQAGSHLIKFDDTNFNVLLGTATGQGVPDEGEFNIFIGYNAGKYNDTTGGGNNGTGNICMGYRAGEGDPGGFAGGDNVYIGRSSGTAAISTDGNVGIGKNALQKVTASDNNMAIGASSMQELLTGNGDNVSVGANSLFSITTGRQNVAIGASALFAAATTSEGNTAIGFQALQCLGGGINHTNVGIGRETGRYLGGGSSNVFIGVESGNRATTALYSACIGRRSMYYNQTGRYNSIIGYQAGGRGAGAVNSFEHTSILGAEAGYNVTTADDCLYLGYKAGYNQQALDDIFILDNQDRGSVAAEITDCLMYGVFNSTVASQTLRFNAGTVSFGAGVDNDLIINFIGTTNSGVLKWMEDEDYFEFGDDIFVGSEEVSGDKFKITSIGGFAVKLTNTTGAATVQGQTVKADPTTNDAVILTAADDEECFGVFLETGVADDAEAWVVVAGIADVAMGDNEAATAGNWVETNSTEAGYADATAGTPAAAPQHFNEIGHCIETVAAGGGGTHILARCVLHFN